MSYYFYRGMWAILDWVFPPTCGGCRRAGYRWCPECRREAALIPGPLCQHCGLPLDRPGLCSACKENPPPYHILRSWLVFEGPIRRALHTLKYRRNLALGDSLAQHMKEYVRALNWPVELVVPIPLSKKRLRERGYNQVSLVAGPLAALQGWHYAPHALCRARETRSQVGLSAAERILNVSGAFHAESARVKGKTILLMDDVATTGATLAAGAAALLEAGANAVYALTVARALPKHGLHIV